MPITDSHGDRYDEHYRKIPEGRDGPWYQSATGDRIWPLDPRVEDVRLLDIARGLANECRFARMLGRRGQWYSVAEHSVLVARFVGLWYPEHPEWEQEAALHDAGEAYGFGDVPRPLKHDPSIRPLVDRVEDRWTAVIYQRFGITSTEESRAAIKRVDNLLAYEERAVVTRDPTLYARHYPEGEPPLKANIQCLSPARAETSFLCCVGVLFQDFRDEAHRLMLAEAMT